MPCALVTLADTVRSPLPSAVNWLSLNGRLQVRSSCTVAVYVWPPRIIVTVSPAAAFVTLPVRVSPAATSAALTILSPARVSIVTTGSELSTSTSCEVEALLPTLSVTLAVTV
ncbi:hypothetical protein OUHCRE8_17840 [Enterobacter asburiae]